jgi:hypothetical protein
MQSTQRSVGKSDTVGSPLAGASYRASKLAAYSDGIVANAAIPCR